jgi:acyl carrier protein
MDQVTTMTAAIDDVTREVIAIVAKNLQDKSQAIGPDDRLDELGLDSFAAVEMIFDLEEKFDIQIPYNSNDSRIEFETVGEIAAAIKNLLGKP